MSSFYYSPASSPRVRVLDYWREIEGVGTTWSDEYVVLLSSTSLGKKCITTFYAKGKILQNIENLDDTDYYFTTTVVAEVRIPEYDKMLKPYRNSEPLPF